MARGHMLRLSNFYGALTDSLPLAGCRRLDEGQTTAELMIEASMAATLVEPVQAMYRYPFRNGITAVPDTGDRPTLRAWLITQYQEREAAADLRATLPPWMIRASNAGGQLGLEEIGASGVFDLRDEAIKSNIRDHADGLTTVGGYHSVVDTTLNELTIQLSNGRLTGLTNEELSATIAQTAIARSQIRAGAIALDQMIRWVNVALREVYARNGIAFEIFRTRPEASQSGPCPECSPLDGKMYVVGTGPIIPVHNRCVCVYLPDMTDWSLPDEVWRG